MKHLLKLQDLSKKEILDIIPSPSTIMKWDVRIVSIARFRKIFTS